MKADTALAAAAARVRKDDSTAADRLHLELKGVPGRHQIVQGFRAWAAEYRRGEAISFPVRCIEIIEKYNGPDQPPLDTRLDDLKLGIRPKQLRRLQDMGYHTLGDLTELDRWSISQLPGFGRKNSKQVFSMLGLPLD